MKLDKKITAQIASHILNRIDGEDINGDTVALAVMNEGYTLEQALEVVEHVFGFKTWE